MKNVVLGNAMASGAESRFPVYAQPKFWRTIPEMMPVPELMP